jgi:phenylalanine ammonia-lyase
MDHLRYYLGLLAKHLDAQISILVTPQFNGGLPSHLVGNGERKFNMGLQGLQIAANTIMPQLLFYGNSLADRFPTHAEQFNQNINSQGFGSANLTRRALDIYRHYLAVSLLFAVQSVDLRTRLVLGHYDARAALSPASCRLYDAVLAVTGRTPGADRAFVWNDDEQALDRYLANIVADLRAEGAIVRALGEIGGPADV